MKRPSKKNLPNALVEQSMANARPRPLTGLEIRSARINASRSTLPTWKRIKMYRNNQELIKKLAAKAK